MEDSSRIRAVAAVDIFVALFILIVGVFVLLFGTSWADYVSMILSTQKGMYGTSAMFKWLTYTVYITYFIGLTTIIYAVKRMIDDVLKTIIKVL